MLSQVLFGLRAMPLEAHELDCIRMGTGRLTSFCVDIAQTLVAQGFEERNEGVTYHQGVRVFLGMRAFGGEFSCG